MRLSLALVLSLFVLTGLASAQHCRKADVDKSSKSCTVPDPALTPGEMDSSLACVSNRDRPRAVQMLRKIPFSLPTVIRQTQRNLLASSIIGFRTGWAEPMDQITSGSSRILANSAPLRKTESNSCCGEKYVWIKP